MSPRSRSSHFESHIDLERMAELDRMISEDLEREALGLPKFERTATPSRCVKCRELLPTKNEARLHCGKLRLTPAHVAQIFRLFREGKKVSEISRITGIAYKTVWSKVQTRTDQMDS